VTFTKVLIIYHSWIHPSIILCYPPSPQQVSLFHFHIGVCSIFTLFTLNTLSLYLHPSHEYHLPRQDFFSFLFSIFENKLFFWCGGQNWGLRSGTIPSASLQPFFVIGVFETRSYKLFAQAVFEPWSSLSLPLESLGLQSWANGAQHIFVSLR
jgi:hypothetical protein